METIFFKGTGGALAPTEILLEKEQVQRGTKRKQEPKPKQKRDIRKQRRRGKKLRRLARLHR